MVKQDNKILAMVGWNCTGDLGPWTFYRSARGQLVFYARVPALNPASPLQATMRERFRQVARDWHALKKIQQARWEEASQLCHLTATGYNLWVYWRLKQDLAFIQRIERVTGLTLKLAP